MTYCIMKKMRQVCPLRSLCRQESGNGRHIGNGEKRKTRAGREWIRETAVPLGRYGEDVPMKAERKTKKKKKSIFLRVALLAFSVYAIVMLAQLQMELANREKDEQTIDQQIEDQKRLNEDLKLKNEDYEKFLEEQAREQGLARPGEIIFQEVPGAE